MKTQPSGAAGGDHPEHEPLQHQVRLLGQDLAVLERAGLGLVGVADGVLRASLLFRHELPLLTGREPSASHSAKTGVLQGRDELHGIDRGAQQAVVARVRPIRVVRPLDARAAQLGLHFLDTAGAASQRPMHDTSRRHDARSCSSRAVSAAILSSDPWSQQARSWQQAISRSGGGSVRKCG